MEGVKYVSLNLLFFIREMQASLGSWWRLYSKVKGFEQPEEEFVREKFDRYLEVLKPIIYRTDMLSRLANNPSHKIFTDVLTLEQTERLLRKYR